MLLKRYLTKFWLLIGYCAGNLPRSWQRGLARCLAPVLRFVLPKRRRVCAVNLRLCFPQLTDKQRERLLRECYLESCYWLFTTLRAWFGNFRHEIAQAKISGLDYLKQAQQAGRGVVLYGGHQCNVDLCFFLLANQIDFHATYLPHKNKTFDETILQARQRNSKHKLLPINNTRAILQTLREGGVVWLTCDQDIGTRASIFAPFLGATASCHLGTRRWAQASGAQVLFCGFYRDENNHYRIDISKVLANYPSDDALRDIKLQNSYLERAIKKNPSQYLWLHKRFKTQPPGISSPYC